MTEGCEWKLILLFTLPLMAGNFLQQLYNAVDGIIVGNFAAAGENALSAVGTCAPITMLFIAIAMGMSTGCSILISQLYGAKRFDEMRRAVSTSLILVVAAGLVFTVVGSVIAKWLLVNVLCVPDTFLADAAAYFSIYCFGLVFQFTYNIVSFILRSLGDSAATLYFLLVSSVTNIILDMVFVAGLHWDVPGVAVATVIAQALSAVVSIVYMFKKYPFLRFAKGEFRFHRDQAAQALRLSIPTTLQQCIISSGHIAIQRIVNDFGITAAFTAGMRVENFILIPIFAFNVGLATFTGQNVGAGKLDRVRTGLKVTQVMGCIVCAAVAVLAYTAAFPLVGLFGVEGETQALGVQYIHFIAPWLLVFCVYIITNGVLQGAGDVMFTAANTISSLLIRCIGAYLLAYFTPVAGTAAWVSLPIGWVWSLALALSRYKWGPWRQKAVTTAADAPAVEEG
jgi:putative MATE family efflux protein